MTTVVTFTDPERSALIGLLDAVARTAPQTASAAAHLTAKVVLGQYQADQVQAEQEPSQSPDQESQSQSQGDEA